MKSKNITIQRIRNSISYSPLRRSLPVIAVALACFALLPVPKAFGVSPAPDGGYPGQNTAEGEDALFDLTTGTDNSATGYHALYNISSGSRNTGTGSGALSSNNPGPVTSSDNTATGYNALAKNTGSEDTATGSGALGNNTSGQTNTAVGYAALSSNTTGGNSIALGAKAGINLTTGSNNIDIGNVGVAGDDKSIRIGTVGTQGTTYVAGIYGTIVPGGTAVYINSYGALGTATSSARFKQDIHSMDKASETILSLRPVTFRYKQELDPNGVEQFGLVAEEVEKVDPALVVHDAGGKPYSVRYEAVNAMLLNEFLKEHQTVQELKTMVAQQNKQIKVLTAGLQKVSTQLEVSKPQPQVASNGK
jgi:hypothetical protein